MTVLETIQRSTDFLAKKGVDSPRLQVELLLAYVLKLPRLRLYLNFDRKVADTDLETVRDLVKRRGNREPLQHLVGSSSFCGLEIAVNRHVLIPRPETELLAERAWTFLANIKQHPPTALDFGTGSGCLAIALAAKCASACVHAVDISPEALEVARQNAERNNVAGRIHFHSGDGFGPLARGLKFDLIVANPPYIPTGEIAGLQPEVRDHDPHLALDGGKDGLGFYRRLAEEAPAFLQPQGKLMLEFGDGQAAAIKGILGRAGWLVESVNNDYNNRQRILVARCGHP